MSLLLLRFVFFFNAPATTEIYTLSLHDALPIFGRPIVAAAAMAGSGACCLVVGLLYGKAPIALVCVALFWGITVVADSAQFSACVTEFADPRYLGTALTLQTCIGFLITTASIRMMSAVPR